MRTALALSVFIAVELATLGPACAQDAGGEGAAPENMQGAQQARVHFTQGLEQFRAHRYREAIQSFQLANQLVPSADLQYNIARAYEELSDYEQAIEYYQNYLRDRVDPPDRGQVEQHIAELRERAERERERLLAQPTTGTLRLTANRDGADVELDGASAGTSPWPEARELPPGRHRLSLSREGYVPFRSEVSIEAGVPTVAYADLTPETRYRAIQADRIFTWIAWGLGVVALGTAIGLGVEAGSRSDNLDDARTWAAYSDVALAAGLGLGVLGLVLWFVEGRTVGTERITVDEDDASGVRTAN
ncbi:MAG: PEGA domain-containing protein [Sandaracinaceae bacterium]